MGDIVSFTVETTKLFLCAVLLGLYWPNPLVLIIRDRVPGPCSNFYVLLIAITAAYGPLSMIYVTEFPSVGIWLHGSVIAGVAMVHLP